jgi:hypothetical protein
MTARLFATATVAAAFCFTTSIFAQTPDRGAAREAPFASGGTVELQLDGGSYTIRRASSDHLRVTLDGNIGKARVDLTTSANHATVIVSNTPHDNFNAIVELPKQTNLVVHLKAGDLAITGISGDKEVRSTAGDVRIDVADPNEYARVDASVKVGDVNGEAFGDSKSGFFRHLQWSGPGRYKLLVSLGAGDISLPRR